MSNANEQAFPALAQSQCRESGETTDHETVGGLTKLEYFAGLAMQGMLANSFASDRFQVASEMSFAETASAAITQARALIAELEKEQQA